MKTTNQKYPNTGSCSKQIKTCALKGHKTTPNGYQFKQKNKKRLKKKHYKLEGTQKRCIPTPKRQKYPLEKFGEPSFYNKG